jgi:hypothetical protein
MVITYLTEWISVEEIPTQPGMHLGYQLANLLNMARLTIDRFEKALG